MTKGREVSGEKEEEPQRENRGMMERCGKRDEMEEDGRVRGESKGGRERQREGERERERLVMVKKN